MSKLILIVEDNELNMKLFDDLLQASGYETIKLLDGSDVLEVAGERRPDLIITDIQLPGRTGFELTRDLKANEKLKHIPVIAISALTLNGKCDAGCNDFIAKPISLPKFLETVAKYLVCHSCQPALT